MNTIFNKLHFESSMNLLQGSHSLAVCLSNKVDLETLSKLKLFLQCSIVWDDVSQWRRKSLAPFDLEFFKKSYYKLEDIMVEEKIMSMMAMDINGLVSIHDPDYIEGDGDGLGKHVVI